MFVIYLGVAVEDTLKFMIIMLVFVGWLWRFNVLYSEYQRLDDENVNAVQSLYVIKNYKISGVPVTSLGDVDNESNLVIPEWNGTGWVYYQVPLKRVLMG